MKIRNDLINDILNGKYSIGSKLPSERFLAETYKVSRITAKKSLDELISRNYAEIHKGKGTFVKRNSIAKDTSFTTGFSAQFEEQGLNNLHSRVLKTCTQPAHHKVALKLKIKLGEPIYIIDRARYLNDEVIAVEYSRIPCSNFPGLLEYDFENESLYKTLEDKYGLVITNSSHSISFHYCDELLGELFNIDQGDPLFKVESVSCYSNSIPFENCTTYFRNDFIFYSSIGTKVSSDN